MYWEQVFQVSTPEITMQICANISVLGVSLTDKLRSENVRKQLNTERMVEEIQEYQKKWHNHVERIPPERLPWQTYSYHPIGRRDIGRPRKRWR
jgi:hypothetical protein